MREVQGIPPAPRLVRLRVLLGYRWPLLLAGGLLAVYGGLWTLMLWFAAGAKPAEQSSLDRGPVTTVAGEVTGLDDPVTVDDMLLQRVTYRYSWRGVDRPDCRSFARFGQFQVGDHVQVELLPETPAISRIEGTLLHVDRALLRPGTWLGLCVVPGGIVLLGWLAGVFHLRRVLVHGDVSVATVARIAPLPLVLPPSLVVEFAFLDHHAQTRRGRHWVRRHSSLGARLMRHRRDDQPERLPVLHDRRFPQWNRLVLAEDFPACVPAGERSGMPHG